MDCGNLFALESNPQIISTKKLTLSFVLKFLPTLGFARPSDAWRVTQGGLVSFQSAASGPLAVGGWRAVSQWSVDDQWVGCSVIQWSILLFAGWLVSVPSVGVRLGGVWLVSVWPVSVWSVGVQWSVFGRSIVSYRSVGNWSVVSGRSMSTWGRGPGRTVGRGRGLVCRGGRLRLGFRASWLVLWEEFCHPTGPDWRMSFEVNI